MQCKVSDGLGNSKCWLSSVILRKTLQHESLICEAGEPIWYVWLYDFGLSILYVKYFIDFYTKRGTCGAFAVLNL